MDQLSTFPAVRWVTGIKQTQRALEKGNVQKVYIAEDADSRRVEPLIEYCKKNNIPIEMVPNSIMLGELCEIDVKAAASGILTNNV